VHEGGVFASKAEDLGFEFGGRGHAENFENLKFGKFEIRKFGKKGETERRGRRRDGETERRRDGETEKRKNGKTEKRKNGKTENFENLKFGNSEKRYSKRLEDCGRKNFEKKCGGALAVVAFELGDYTGENREKFTRFG